MDPYNETAKTWNKVAAIYQEKFMNLDIYNQSYETFIDAIPKTNASIFEIGCGPGNITKYLLSKRSDLKIYGIDVAPSMIELARQNNPTAKFDVMDCRNIGEINQDFDGIVCGFCLPYLSEGDARKLLIDSFNLLTENGMMYISFVEGDPNDSGFKTSSTGDRAYFYYYELEELKKQLIESGFGMPEIYKVIYNKNEKEVETHTIVLTRKR
ncbi:MAG TPA: class I SAM-dependent methyltransferase [Candidatus Gracilibacteria bacterium]|nr:class I SAM-dependent methyltransferase [Candidatus Gracilibacteria bacterium]